MTPDEIYPAILRQFYTTWATCTPIAPMNRSFKVPESAWVVPIIEMADTFVGELGDDGVGIRTGLFQVNINIPPDGGYLQAMRYADRIEKAFRRADVGGVIFDDPSTTVDGIVDNHFRVVVRINFHAWIGE